MALRDLVIVTVVLLLALWTLRRPWIGILNWTWLSIMNPHRYAWGFAYSAPVAAIAASATLLALLFTKEKRSPFQGPPTIWLFVFAIWVTVSWLLGVDPEGDHPQWDKVMKIYLMTFVALALIRTKIQIIAFVTVTIGSLAFLAAKGGVFTILTAGSYRVWGPPESFIADNNHFALATIITLPLLHFLQLQLSRPWQRHAMSAIMLLCVASALGSHSRGAFLAITAMAFVFWLRSTKKTPIAVLIVISLVMILPMMPEHWWERMATLKTYEQDASAMGRINAWLVAIEVAKHNFFGAGMNYQYQHFFSAFGVYDTTVLAAHSVYFQILGNHGFIGLLLYLTLWVSTYRAAGQLRKQSNGIPALMWAGDLGAMVQVSLIGFAVGGAFLSMPYFDLPYNLMVAVVLALKLIESGEWRTEINERPLLEELGLARARSPRKPRRSGARKPRAGVL